MQLKKVCAGAVAIATALGGLALVAPAASAAPVGVDQVAPFAFGGAAYGSQVKVAGPLANSGKTAFLAIGCTRRAPIDKVNSTGAVDIPTIGHVGAVETRGLTRADDATEVYRAETRSSVADAALAADVIQIGAIQSRARAINDPGGYRAVVTYSIASLSIAGVPVELTGELNQVVPVPGVGTLTLGESRTKADDDSAFAKITAVVLRLNAPSNTVVRIGHSQARIDDAPNAIFSGGAYGSTVRLADGTVTSGKTANQPIPCAGTRGRLRTNEIATVDVGGLGTAENVVSTVRTRQGSPPDSFPEAHATNTIESVSLIGGLAVLTGIQARVNVYENENGDVTYNTNGTQLGSITVAGLPIPVPVPGGSVGLPGVGTLFFFEENELKGGRGVEVTAVRIVLLDGSTIVLSHAAAVIK